MQVVEARDLFGNLKPQELQDLKSQEIDKTGTLANILSEFDDFLGKWKMENGRLCSDGSSWSQSKGFSAQDIAAFCSVLPVYEKTLSRYSFSSVAGNFVNALILDCVDERVVLKNVFTV